METSYSPACQGPVQTENNHLTLSIYEGCSKWIAYFYLETLIFKLAQKYSFHALEVLPVARNAKFQRMYPLLEGVTVRWFGHSNKVLILCWGFTAQSTQWGHVERGQFT